MEPGATWRLLTKNTDGQTALALENDGVFDELVVDDWLHVEQMNERSWWLRVGDARINVEIRQDRAQVSVERGVYD